MITTVTLTKVFKKEVTIEIDQNLLKGKNEEEIVDFLREEYRYDDSLFENAELIELEFTENSINNVDTDRFDIVNENGEHIYGGHL